MNLNREILNLALLVLQLVVVLAVLVSPPALVFSFSHHLFLTALAFGAALWPAFRVAGYLGD